MRNSIEGFFQVDKHCPRQKPFIHMLTNCIRKEGNSQLSEKMNCAKAPAIDKARGESFPIDSYVADGRQLSPEFSTGSVKLVCQLATMGFLTQMKGSARNVCTFF